MGGGGGPTRGEGSLAQSLVGVQSPPDQRSPTWPKCHPGPGLSGFGRMPAAIQLRSKFGGRGHDRKSSRLVGAQSPPAGGSWAEDGQVTGWHTPGKRVLEWMALLLQPTPSCSYCSIVTRELLGATPDPRDDGAGAATIPSVAQLLDATGFPRDGAGAAT